MIENDLIRVGPDQKQLLCQGDWILIHVPKLKILFEKMEWPTTGELIINGSAISKMDSAGAWFLYTSKIKIEKKGHTLKLEAFPEACQTLLDIVKTNLEKEKRPKKALAPNWIAKLGQEILLSIRGLFLYFNFIGQLTMESLRILRHPTHLRWKSFATVIYSSGYQALPIITLLSFMIGIVLTYQMGLQLRTYGANIYIVDLLGLSVLREFGPLLTAIMVAGRTGSAFTAQLGIMKINQEVDALSTLGVTPAELLLLPKIAGLFIALPLLTIWADIFGVIGGMVMANNLLNLTWYDFLHRFPTVVPLKALLLGLGKAPVFALIIGSIGCFQGTRVGNSADSLGTNTTRSVVLAIFFIIVADAFFSVLFSVLKL